jgi:hypothetical protein
MTRRGIAWLDAAIWTLIYAGLLMVVLGVATHEAHVIAGWSLGVVGSMVTAAGIVLVWVRSRVREESPGSGESAQSTSKKRGNP